MLLVFAMAAAVVVMLYMEAPRLAQQALRAKEQQLIDRGEQYQRAIQVFVRTVKKYPQSLDELEKFQDKRYLRQRYKDPFTGDTEWRLIHIQAGVFTDSKVYGPKKEGEDKEPRQTFVGELPSIGNAAGDPNDPNAQNPAAQRRASDRPAIASGQGGTDNQQADPNAPPPDPNAPPADPNAPRQDPNAPPGQPMPYVPGGQQTPYVPGGQQVPNQSIPGVPTAPGQPGAAPVIPNAPGVPGMPSFRPANPIQTRPQGQQGTNQNTPSSGGFIGGAIPAPGGVSSSQSGGTGGFIGGGTPSAPAPTNTPGNSSARPGVGYAGSVGGAPTVPGGLPSGGPGRVPTAAADLIRQILTTPRQGGMPGAQGAAQGGMGSGIAGVASKREATGIKIYNEREKYDEWEFVYDQSKEMKSQMGAAGVNSQGTNQPGGPLQGVQPGSALGGSQPGTNTRGLGSQTATPAAPSTGRGSGGSGFIGGPIAAPAPAPPKKQ